MGSITSYQNDSRLDSANVFLKDGIDGTKIITANRAAQDMAGMISAVNHRNTYRGKFLGNSVTDTQKAAIQNGTFDDLFIGDYWTINANSYAIGDMNYWKRCGDTEFTANHLLMVPMGVLYNAKMNDEYVTTTGGYVGSDMYKTYLNDAKTTINAAFGTMVLSHREYFINAVTDGRPSGGAWYDSTVDLMNEIMVYGCNVFSPMNDGTTIPTNYTIDKQQIALFRLHPESINIRATWWLRSVLSSVDFAHIYEHGGASFFSEDVSYGVRPAFAIG